MIIKVYPVSTAGDITRLCLTCCHGNTELDLAKYNIYLFIYVFFLFQEQMVSWGVKLHLFIWIKPKNLQKAPNVIHKQKS